MPLRFILVTLCSLLVAGTVHAQAKPADKAAAEALFDQGLSLMREGRYPEACSRLEDSQAIERGLGTMLYLADCYEKLGRTASAWAMFREAASMAEAQGQQERAEAGAKRAQALEPKLSTLEIEVPAEHRVPELRILREGEALSAGLWNVAVPVDPGAHRVEAQAPGYEPWRTTVQVAPEAGRSTLKVPLLKALPAPVAAAGVEPAAAVAEERPMEADETSSPEGMSRRRIAALSVGSAGVLGVGLGAVFGGMAIAKNNDAEDRCRSGCTPAGAKASQDAVKFANISTGMWAAGAALLGTGLVLFFLDPDKEQPPLAVSVGPGTARLTLRGAF